MSNILEQYSFAFSHLRRGITKFGPAPHKLILLLAIIREFEAGNITQNKIVITASLLESFMTVWRENIHSGHSATFALPFFHMRNEKFWQLHAYPQYQTWLNAQDSIASVVQLRKTIQCATLASDLFDLLINPICREALKQTIFDELQHDGYEPIRELSLFGKSATNHDDTNQNKAHPAFYDEAPDYKKNDTKKEKITSLTYQEWNNLLLEHFFYKSVEQSVIRLDVSPGWFDSLKSEIPDARNDLIKAVCERPKSFSKMFQEAITEQDATPSYLPLLVFFCIPWGEIDDDDNGYDEYIKNHFTGDENYSEKIRLFFEGNKRFRDFIPELFYKLKVWADSNANVKGTFCFARLHGNIDNKNSYFRSQVLLRPKDETRLNFLFNKLPFRKHYAKDELLNHLLSNLSYKLPTAILNLWHGNDDDEQAQKMRFLLQGEAAQDIYSEWEDWVEEGRPEVSYGTQNSPSSYSAKRPQLLLALSMHNGLLIKHLVVRTSDIEDIKDSSFTIFGIHFKLILNAEFSNLICENSCDLENVWYRLAEHSTPLNIENKLSFYPEKYYVMTSKRPYLVQDESNSLPPQGDYFLLHLASAEIADDIAKEFPNAKNFPCGNNWITTRCDRTITLFSNNDKTSVQKQIKLSGGERTKYRLGLREYLIDFLPSIEAYLPDNGYDYEILEPAASGAIKLEEVNLSDIEVTADDDVRYSWRRFEIICNDENISYCKVRFVIDNNNDNLDLKTLDFYISNEEFPISTKNRMDHFGELVKSDNEQQYWPEYDKWQKESSFCDEIWDTKDADLDEFPWHFLKTLREATGTRGISNRTLYWTFIYHHCQNMKPWRYPKDYNYDLLLLSYLSVIDIYTDKHGLWSKFFALPPVIYPLPDGINFILAGCYPKELLIKLRDSVRATSSCKISIKKHSPGVGVDIRLLPPHVILTGNYNELHQIATKYAIAWVKTPPAIGYSNYSASVDDWFTMVWNGPLELNNVKNGINNWYSPSTYTIQESTNPFINTERAFLQPNVCFYTKPAPFIKNSRVKYFQMTQAGCEDYFVYIYDRSWARWQCHSNVKASGEDERRVFNIPYDERSGSLWLPESLKLPKILARAAVACTGKIPAIVDDFDLYTKSPFGHNFSAYNKKCARFQGIPILIAQIIADKINANLVKIEANKEYEKLPTLGLLQKESSYNSAVVIEGVSIENVLDIHPPSTANWEHELVEFMLKNYCDCEVTQLLNDVLPINKLRKTQIFFIAAEDENDSNDEKYGKLLALSIMKYLQHSWQAFYKQNSCPLESDIKQEHEILERDVKYFMLNNYTIFFQKDGILEKLTQSQTSWKNCIKILCGGIGEVFANFSGLRKIKMDLLRNECNDEKKRNYEQIYDFIINMLISWYTYFETNYDLSQTEDYNEVIEKIIKHHKDICEHSYLLTSLHQGDCCSPFFYHLLRDRSVNYNRQNDTILEKTKHFLEDYIKNYPEAKEG